MSENKNYIDKEDMMNELRRSHDIGKATERLGEMVMILCERYSHNHLFRDYERKYGKAFKEDLLSAGWVACVRAWDKFDMEKFDNPFSFFTTCIFRAYIGYLSKEYKYGNIKNAMKVEDGMRGDYGYEEMLENEKLQAQEKDEENSGFENIEVGYEEPSKTQTDEFGIPLKTESEEDPTEEESPFKTYRVSNPLLEAMTLWGGDEELIDPNEEDDTMLQTNKMFGIGETK